MSSLSVIILAKNEEKNIGDCIKSAKFADEILIIDDYSTDSTASIAKTLGARVVKHSLNNSWESQKNFAISITTGEWIFFLDADERISSNLADEISKIVQNNTYICGIIRRYNQFRHYTATHGSVRPDKVLRLCPKKGAHVVGRIHEQLKAPYEEKVLSGKLYHRTYENWEQYFRKFNQYTSLLAQQYVEQKKTIRFVSHILLRPLWAFIKIYLIQGGFRDGKIGFVLSMNHAFYTFTKYVKAYYLYRSDGEL